MRRETIWILKSRCVGEIRAAWRYGEIFCEPQIDFRLSGRGLLARGFVQGDTFPEIQSRRRTCDLGNGRSANSTCAHTWSSSCSVNALLLLQPVAHTLSAPLNLHARESFVPRTRFKILKRPKSLGKKTHV